MSEASRTGMPWPLAFGGAVLLFVLVSLRLFVLPAVDDPEVVLEAPADAVVVLGGGQGERIRAALGVLPRLPGDAPALVLSVPYEEPLLTCGSVPGQPGVEVRCLVPAPATTAGEAAGLASLAAEQQWQRVVVATSDYHVTRARVLVSRCVEQLAPGLEVLWIAGDTAATSLRGGWAIATEWPSLLGTPWDHEPACSGEPGV